MITAEELQQVRIFECLDEPERQRLAQKAADVRLAAGDWLIREGDTTSFFVILEGRLALSKDIMGRVQEFAEFEYKTGDFFGETPILLGTPALVSLRAVTPCKVARFDRQQFQALIRDSESAAR